MTKQKESLPTNKPSAVRVPRKSSMYAKISKWLHYEVSTDDELTVKDIAKAVACADTSVWHVVQDLIADGRLVDLYPNRSANLPKLYGKIGRRQVVQLFEIPLNKQPPLWDYMHSLCGWSERPEFTYADHFQGINRWCDIVVSIWEARNQGIFGPSLSSSLGQSSSIMYSAVRGGVKGD